MAPATTSMEARRSLFVAVIFLLVSFLALQVSAHGGAGDDHDEDSNSADGGEQVDLHSKGLIAVKIWCLVIMFVGTFAGGVSPYFYRWNESFLLLGTQFAGGVFLGTSLMHFLSDSDRTFKSLSSKDYPFAFMLASAGYLLTMLSDVVIAAVTQKALGGEQTRVTELESAAVAGEVYPDSKDGGGRADIHPALVRTTTVGDTVLLILALCFHSVFEGIAVGVAGSKAEAWRNLWTICLHKIFAAIAMGIALLRMLPKRPLLMTAAYSFAFAISSPIGVGIGIAIDATAEGRVADWIYAISMALACGVFVYVAINHLVAKGFKPRRPSYFDSPFYKFLAVLGGVAVIAVVMIWD